MVQKEVHRLSVLHHLDVGKRKDIRRSCPAQPLRMVVQGDNRKSFFPCSGNGNGQSWNNRGSNGNYWSSSFNSATNGRNLNFNSGGVNPQNNNNRFNGFAVRPVQHSILSILLNILSSNRHAADEKEVATRPLRSLLRCEETQGKTELCAPMGEESERKHGVTVRRLVSETLSTPAVKVFHCGLPEEAGDICSHVQGQDSASSVLQLYARTLRTHLHTGLLQLHQGQGNTLRHWTGDGLLQEGESQLATQVLCYAPGYSRILHAHCKETSVGDSYRQLAQDGYAQMAGREDVERRAGHGLSDMAYGSDRDAGPSRELYHRRRQGELGRTGPSEEHAALGGWAWTAYWQPYVAAILERISKPLRPVHETRTEMQVLREVCGRCHHRVARQGVASFTCSKDTGISESGAWAGAAYGKAAHQRSASWHRIPWQLYKTLQDICFTQDPGKDGEEDSPAGLYEAMEGATQCQLLPWNLSAYGLLPYQTQDFHERGISENRYFQCRYD